MNLESGFDIEWPKITFIEDESADFFKLTEAEFEALERLRQDPHYCLIAGLPAPK